jgi:ADP-heptose:LPS heptosyltransferase
MRYVFKKRWKRTAMAVIDALGGVLFIIPNIFRRMRINKGGLPKRILVVRLDQLGDMIQALPFFERLKLKYPDHEVHAVCVRDCAFLLEKNRNIDRLYTVSSSWFYPERRTDKKEYKALAGVLKKTGMGMGFDLRGDIRNLFFLRSCGAQLVKGYGSSGGGFLADEKTPYDRDEHEIDKNLRLIGEKAPVLVTIDFPAAAADETAAEKFILEHGAAVKKKIIVHPFTRAASKMWGTGKYNELIKRLVKDGRSKVFVIGGAQDAGNAGTFEWNENVINCIGSFNLAGTIALIKKSDIFIGNDSGPQYFAAYSGIKTCVIYGYTVNHKRWMPKVKAENFIDISVPVDCGPCELFGCGREDHRCMRLITVEMVWNLVENWVR